MKKIIICIALAATVLNGIIGAMSQANYSQNELKLDDIEILAEAETDCDPLTAVAVATLILTAAGLGWSIFSYYDSKPNPGTHWADESRWDACAGRYIVLQYKCENDNDGVKNCVYGAIRHAM